MAESTGALATPKDPRTIARKYQLDLCKRATEENTIVYLGTGCGKTHIAVLLMYEFGHLIRKPGRKVCVFLAPTIPLVRQQAVVIQNSTDFEVKSYFGNCKSLKDHQEWNEEIEQVEVLVMTPQILLHNLRHCFIKMELIALLIFDECHHAQAQSRHPYAQIMKEFYKTDITTCPRIFGMTASPVMGKGGSNQLHYTKCINSLESLLDAKVCSVDDNTELESIVASPDIKVYLYGSISNTASSPSLTYRTKLDAIKHQCMSMIREKIHDSEDYQKSMKLLSKTHENLTFCLENIGLNGAIQAVHVLSSSKGLILSEKEMHSNNKYSGGCLEYQYLSSAHAALGCDIVVDCTNSNSLALDALEEPFFSKKMLVLIGILSTFRQKPDMKCIIFVKRIIVARALARILGSLAFLDFWKCENLVGFHSGATNISRKKMNAIVEKFRSGEVNLLVATKVAEEGLDIQTCCLVVRFDLPESVASFIQSRGRARMQNSEYVFLVERGNLRDEELLNHFISGEDVMNHEVNHRTSSDTFDKLEETIYKVSSTGAAISTGCSISLLHRYCAKLPRDIYFSPSPKFFYTDNLEGSVCTVVLPPNAPFRQVDGLPCSSRDEARRAACFRACVELHKRGALTDYLLPGLSDTHMEGLETHHFDCDDDDDDWLREELHEMLVPSALKESWTSFDDHVDMYFYYIRLVPVPEDRHYRMFGLFVKVPLPKEAETMEVDLHLSKGRIVKTGFVPYGMIRFDREEILLAQNFQEMFLKIILDRSEFFSDFVPLGESNASQHDSSTFYLLLPVKQQRYGESMNVDWTTVRCCVSSPVFVHPTDSCERAGLSLSNTLQLLNGPVKKCDILNSLIFTPHNKLFFFIDGLLHDTNAYSTHKSTTYAEHYKKRFGIQLSYPEQPFLKAKQLFSLRNLLHNRLQETTETREIEEHFVELPPELCSLKIVGFSKDIGSSLSLLPSLMHRLENLLVAIELKDVFSAAFPEGSEIRADTILEALTTEKCLERFSLERFEVLGDAFLKYAVGRHSFVSYQGLDEGQLTRKRSSIVNNFNLYELAIRNNLQVYICNESFEPSKFFALGRPCTVVCDADSESVIHFQHGNGAILEGTDGTNVKCTKSHRWLHRKTIADGVEALVGAFLVGSGFKAATAFLRWIGIHVDIKVSDLCTVLQESNSNMSLCKNIDIVAFEDLLGYKFRHKGLLLEAFVHPSYNEHSGGCYQKLEFLGDAVLEYLITSYLYSVYPDLKPGQITDLRSLTVNNNSFAHIAVRRSFHKFLVKDSNCLTKAIDDFQRFVHLSELESELLEEPACPKVLGDIVESYIGAVLLDTGFDLNYVWKLMLTLLEPVLTFSSLKLNPSRELRELCQSYNFELGFPDPVKEKDGYFVKVEVDVKGDFLTYGATNQNSKVARKMAAQEALYKLKALGYKHKSKSLEEILRTTRRKEPELVGFNEEPMIIMSCDADSMPLEKLQNQESEAAPSEMSLYKVDPVSLYKQLPHPIKDWHKPVVAHKLATSGATEKSLGQEINGALSCKSAKSQLLELCAAKYWSNPSYECCKDEGPDHLKMFTFKVIVQVEGTSTTQLECYSEPKTQKKAAKEHAAVGALWCLQHLGYIH